MHSSIGSKYLLLDSNTAGLSTLAKKGKNAFSNIIGALITTKAKESSL